MAKVFIIGAAGKVGRRLVEQLAECGHQPLALHRKQEQSADLAKLGGSPVAGDLTSLSVERLAAMMTGADAVIFSAGAGGAGPEVTNAIDGRGLELAVEAAVVAGVRRFLLVSVFPDALRDAPHSEAFENYIRVKKLADAHLVASRSRLGHRPPRHAHRRSRERQSPCRSCRPLRRGAARRCGRHPGRID